MKLSWKSFEIRHPGHFRLSDFPTGAEHPEPPKKTLDQLLQKDIGGIANLQNILFAENRQALLIIMQGMDSAGKDSAIKHIMTGVNPQGVDVVSFKHPSDQELSHDYLWRHYLKLPARGSITIFNRSHYENVLISRVHPEIVLAERIPGMDKLSKVDHDFWTRRYRQINDFERTLTENGTRILKFFFHLSGQEQRKRFLKRIEERQKHWKFSSADLKERAFWKDYQHAYETAIHHTSTNIAPWWVIPADDKWYTHLVIGKVILETLKKMDPQFPATDQQEEKLMAQAKKKLSGEK